MKKYSVKSLNVSNLVYLKLHDFLEIIKEYQKDFVKKYIIFLSINNLFIIKQGKILRN